MRLKSSYTSAAARPKLVSYLIFGVRSTHCSRFSANGKKDPQKFSSIIPLFHTGSSEGLELKDCEETRELPEQRGGCIQNRVSM